MKLRSAPIDDVFQELLLALDDDHGVLARVGRRIFTWSYTAHKAAMLLLLRLPWRRGALDRRRE